MNMTQQLIFRGLLSTPIIAAMACSPLYVVIERPHKTFLEIWGVFVLVTLICWGIQIFFFTLFKKRNYASWQYFIFLLLFTIVILYATNPNVHSSTEFFKPISERIVLLFRFCLASSINFMIFLIIDLVYTNEKRIQLVEENAALQFSNLESKYQLLKAQINPHFLFNALNISKSLIKNQPQNAEKYIVQLSEFLRRSVNNQQKSISLEKELENCQQYINLQKVRFENAFTYTVDVDEMDLDKKLPFYALITLIENAFKHNSFSVDEPLDLLIKTKDDYVMMKNNLKVKKGVVSTQTGLSNLNQRSKMFSNTEIDMENDGQHFCVKVKLIVL